MADEAQKKVLTITYYYQNPTELMYYLVCVWLKYMENRDINLCPTSMCTGVTLTCSITCIKYWSFYLLMDTQNTSQLVRLN
jgi:hypothetical protein